MDCSDPDTEGREHPDLLVATEAARERLQDLAATALLSRSKRIPLGIAICGKEGTVLREVAIDAAITEIAKGYQASGSTSCDISAGPGANAFGESTRPGRAEVSLTQRPFAASVRPTPSVAN
ncbi:DUF6894 family protein [Rhizobium leguminosarum]|uniref:DUF6894 family protein n=1 Tax=Rhizobium leguminosarum TaxID=384 RepID=UPI003965771E